MPVRFNQLVTFVIPQRPPVRLCVPERERWSVPRAVDDGVYVVQIGVVFENDAATGEILFDGGFPLDA